jgi:transcriptional regulator with XRE-family HTH domain
MGRSVIAAKEEPCYFPLGAILLEKRVSQSELARRTGMTPTYINRLVRSRSNPNWKTILLIVRALDLDLGDFRAI